MVVMPERRTDEIRVGITDISGAGYFEEGDGGILVRVRHTRDSF
jgi:hypothetical protein